MLVAHLLDASLRKECQHHEDMPYLLYKTPRLIYAMDLKNRFGNSMRSENNPTNNTSSSTSEHTAERQRRTPEAGRSIAVYRSAQRLMETSH